MKPIEYLLCQMELEGIQRVGGNLIARRSPGAEDFPLALLAETCDGERVICFDELLPPKESDEISRSGWPFEIQATMNVLEIAGDHAAVRRFRTFVFPDAPVTQDAVGVSCFRREDPKVAAFGFNDLADAVYGIECDGRIVSACVSSRQNSKAGEAWVYTHPDYRRRGLARRVVLAWAASMQEEGLIAFYSHEMENTNSALLAKKLNLIHVFDETVVEKFHPMPASR